LKERIMTKWTIAVAVVAVAAVVGVRAQSGGGMGKDKGKIDKPMSKEVTYTGCVAAGTKAGTFLLNNMTSDMDMKKDAMGKDTMAKDTMPSSMMFMGTAVDFSKHVGHKVSVTGTMEKMDGMAETNTMATPDTMAKADAMAKPGAMTTMHMMVTSMKMMATSCGM
jgi:hypothetical protein